MRMNEIAGSSRLGVAVGRLSDIGMRRMKTKWVRQQQRKEEKKNKLDKHKAPGMPMPMKRKHSA